MESDEHTEVSPARAVYIRKRWHRNEFMQLSGGGLYNNYVSPKLLLENDPTKMLQVRYGRVQVGYGTAFRFTLSVTIEGHWVCRGSYKVLAGSDVIDFGSVVTASGLEESVFETHAQWDFVEINIKFFLDAEGNKNFVAMSCDDVCNKLLTSEGGPCSFVLKVGEKTVMVHGCVLAMHSEVFKRMIEQDGFREGRQRVVEITDADYDSVMAMVRFMHGFSDAAYDHAEGVLPLADKYAVHPLKEFAVATLKERIDLSAVVRIATLAFLHSAPTLLEECRKYVAENFDEVLETAEWKNVCVTNNTELLMKLVCKK